MSPESWSAIFAGVASLSAVATAAVAGWSLHGQRRDSRDRTRPFVQASLELPPFARTTGYLDLVIQNVGHSVAADVKLSFSPELPPANEPPSSRGPFTGAWIRERYEKPIDTMTPGQRLVNTYANLQHGAAPMPTELDVTVVYKDEHGVAYTSTFHLSTALFDNETAGGPAGDTGDQRLTRAVEELAWQTWRSRGARGD